MSIQGKNSKSYKKKNVRESNSPHTGFKNIVFAHEFASAGEAFIPFSSLATPARWTESGLVNPSPSSLINANLQAFRSNFTVTSSARGIIQKEEYIVYGNRIEFKDITSLVNEVFEVEVADIMISGNLIVDMQTIRIEGEMQDTDVLFNMGYEFDVNNEEIIVFRDGIQMFRSDNNESSGTTGNYYYQDTGNGKASVIEFFDPSVGVEPILIASTGGRVDNPNTSTFQEIEKVQGQIDAMIPTLAGLAGVPTTDFQSSPNQVDLKYFGDLLLSLRADTGKVGDVKTSMLTEAQFQAQHNGTWVLMDGRGVTAAELGADSEYFNITGNATIPDMNGKFLRGAATDSSVNPDGPSSPGDVQDDATAVNGLSASSSTGGGGTHNHVISIYDGAGGNYYGTTGSGFFTGNSGSTSSTPMQLSSTVGDHTHSVSTTLSSTETETRPTNVSINYFIKINV